MQIHGKEYTEVKDRIKEFRIKYPDWSIDTELMSPVEKSPEWVLFRATLRAPGVVLDLGEHLEDGQLFTGWAYEERVSSSSQVNFSSWVENCETSAIGRALANMDLTIGDSRPSAEEMAKVERAKKSKEPESPAAVNAEVTTNAEPPAQFLRKTLGPVRKVDGVKPSTLTMLYKRSNDLRDIVGHDKYLIQALENRKIKEIASIQTEATAQQLLEVMSDLLDFTSDRVTKAVGKVVKLSEVPDEERAKIIESLDKMSLLI